MVQALCYIKRSANSHLKLEPHPQPCCVCRFYALCNGSGWGGSGRGGGGKEGGVHCIAYICTHVHETLSNYAQPSSVRTRPIWSRVNKHRRTAGSNRVSRFGLAVGRRTSVRIRFGSPFSSKVVVCGHCLVTLSLTINETLKWLSSLPILMQESFWW